MKFKREDKYLVFKREDVINYLSSTEQKQLDEMGKFIRACRAGDGKKKHNTYVVVNEDEPYAEKVWELIREATNDQQD